MGTRTVLPFPLHGYVTVIVEGEFLEGTFGPTSPNINVFGLGLFFQAEGSSKLQSFTTRQDMTTAHRYVSLEAREALTMIDPHLILQEDETRTRLQQEHSTLNHSPHTPNSNSAIKDRRRKQKSHNEISVLNSLLQKPKLHESQDEQEPSNQLPQKTTLHGERNGYSRMLSTTKMTRLPNDGKY